MAPMSTLVLTHQLCSCIHIYSPCLVPRHRYETSIPETERPAEEKGKFPSGSAESGNAVGGCVSGDFARMSGVAGKNFYALRPGHGTEELDLLSHLVCGEKRAGEEAGDSFRLHLFQKSGAGDR